MGFASYAFNVKAVIRQVAALAILGDTESCLLMRFQSILAALGKNYALLLLMESMIPTSAAPPLNYCHIPIMIYKRAEFPNTAEHISFAQGALGKPVLLTYLGAAKLWLPAKHPKDINREQACGKFQGSAAAKLTYRFGNPPYSCDEYPFASTYEGGSRASTAAVPYAEQSPHGAFIGNFYRKAFPDYKLIDEGWFAVVVQ